ncbi:MAG: TraR/DksA C4-type zinc finger protein [bacterium]
MTIDTNHFKGLLEAELKTLEGELATIARKNPSNKADWEGVEPEMNTDTADEEDVADALEGYETNLAILSQLETRLGEVKDALKKINSGTYGVCETSGEMIEMDRLEANPAARTCKAHMN